VVGGGGAAGSVRATGNGALTRRLSIMSDCPSVGAFASGMERTT